MNRPLRLFLTAFALVAALAACGGGKTNTTNTTTNNTANAPNGAAVPADLNCGAVQPVWVNTRTHVYHEPGDQWYGHTKNGKYECPNQAAAEGDRPAGGSSRGMTNSNNMNGAGTSAAGNGAADNGTATGSGRRHHKHHKSSY